MIHNDHDTADRTAIVPGSTAGATNGGVAAPPQQESPVAMLDNRMRGRWRIAVALGLVLGGALATVGYRRTVPMYQSHGRIHVSYAGREILYKTPETEAVSRSNYELLVNRLRTGLLSQQTVQAALDDPALGDLALVDDPRSIVRIQKGLEAGYRRGTDLIDVSLEWPHPLEAQRLLDSILLAFDRNDGWQADAAERRSIAQKRDALRVQLEEQLTEISTDLREFIAEKPERRNGDNIGSLVESSQLYLAELKRELIELEYRLRAIDEAAGGSAANSNRPPTDEEIAAMVPQVAALRDLRDQLRTELSGELETRKQGTGYIKQLQDRLDDVERQYQAALDRARKWGLPSGAVAVESVDELQGRRDFLQQQEAAIKIEIQELIADQARIAQLRDDKREIEGELSSLSQLIKQNEVEADALHWGKISVEGTASLPIEPSSDKRAKQAVMGFVAGLGASLGIFFVLGTLDRRTFSASQLRDSDADYSCLGVLPDLGRSPNRTDLPETAAQCIHQIRNRLETLRAPGTSFMVVVTSPYQGDGKTSLAMSLAWSYAIGGFKTLLVDCDFHGRSLTTQMGLTGQPGLKEAVRAHHINGEIQPIGIENLSGLGIGIDPTFGPEALRRDQFLLLSQQLRAQFDVIIADTGPFIGSVELLPVASASNGVLFPVRRGRSRARLGECIADLNAMRVPCLGVVLNRADQADCSRFVSTSTISRRRLPDGQATPEVTDNLLIKAMSTPTDLHPEASDEVKR